VAWSPALLNRRGAAVRRPGSFFRGALDMAAPFLDIGS
jgi:hypothetical protein